MFCTVVWTALSPAVPVVRSQYSLGTFTVVLAKRRVCQSGNVVSLIDDDIAGFGILVHCGEMCDDASHNEAVRGFAKLGQVERETISDRKSLGCRETCAYQCPDRRISLTYMVIPSMRAHLPHQRCERLLRVILAPICGLGKCIGVDTEDANSRTSSAPNVLASPR